MTPENDDRRTLRPAQAANYLGCSTATLWRWAKTLEHFPQPLRLPGQRVTVWFQDELEVWLKSAGSSPAQVTERSGYTGGPISDGGMDPRNTPPDRRVRSMTSSVGTTRDGYLVRQVVVECEDGTLWRLCDNEAGTDHWVRLPAIPGR